MSLDFKEDFLGKNNSRGLAEVVIRQYIASGSGMVQWNN